MKHKYAEMIKARVDNMELVLLVRAQEEWKKSCNDFPTLVHLDYFLCHPKHANETIHWLNGGAVKCQNVYYEDLSFICTERKPWDESCWYMNEAIESSIKPKKEKRWIVVYGSNAQLCSKAFSSRYEAEGFNLFEPKSQIIEIEIEV